MLRFSVDADGEVIGNSIETLEEQPAGYFESSSINAARRLTFENTRGETVEDVRYVFRYLLEESARVRAESGADEIQFRELIPSRYVTPNYPEIALELELEGYVVVQFTVTEQGAVENVEITEAEPPGVFDDEAIAAALRLRFEPRIVFDGAVRVEDVTYRFDWRLPR
jgi:TonB family protein